jgi:2-phospho-L-lactate guanylyltransferase
MSLWAIIPVKPLRRGKSRLAGVLSEEERTVLNITLLENTLRTLKQVQEIDQILVVSRDTGALALARDFKARTVQEGKPGLNTALKRATIVAQAYAAQDVMILPADLPLINVEDIRTLIGYLIKPPVVVVAPDRRNDGTNALLVSPAGSIDYMYGVGSFKKHVDQAKVKGMRVEVCNLQSFALDLDIPEDLELLNQIQSVKIRP